MINGIQLRDAFVSGANNISNYRQQVDALNVFPVPDGPNMYNGLYAPGDSQIFCTARYVKRLEGVTIKVSNV